MEDKQDNVRIELNLADLERFSDLLIEKAKKQDQLHLKDKYLSKQQVRDLCGVCDTTLWHWDKKGYLKKVKVGKKIFYRKSDIGKIIN